MESLRGASGLVGSSGSFILYCFFLSIKFDLSGIILTIIVHR